MDPNERFEANKAFPYFIIKRYWPNLQHDEDIQQLSNMALWIACTTYKEDAGTAFSTYAARCINNAIANSFRKKRIDAISLNTPVGDDTDATIENMLVADGDMTDNIFFSSAIATFYADCSDRELQILSMRLDELTQQQIGDSLGLSQAHVSRLIRRLRTKYNKFRKRYY